MKEITLTQILIARENRVLRQKGMLQQYRVPVICFTMNIAGPVKASARIRRGFDAGLQALQEALPPSVILEQRVFDEPTGYEAYLSVAMDVHTLKEKCVFLEDTAPMGRLWDMDVLDVDGRKLSRQGQVRGCIVCRAPGRACAAGRKHSVSELQDATNAILFAGCMQIDSERIGKIAKESLDWEVGITPKPGLVDRNNNGSHTDMDIALFRISAEALQPYFTECVKIGIETASDLPEITFNALRHAGIKAEEAMFAATGGVNTHKGAIFTLGLLCGGIGRLWSPECPVAGMQLILRECGRMCSNILQDFQRLRGGEAEATSGQRLYETLGLQGIRGEAFGGFPSIAHVAIPAYQDCRRHGLTENHIGAVTLLHLIANVQDTNLYCRGGVEGAAYAATEAKRLLENDPYPCLEEIARMDQLFMERKLSPGGCADLLAATHFLLQLAENGTEI
ncbi:MAG: triphosphoribosyl-dephospho-CoA synthase CitG [Ruminococcaceae bacterium]|nr:triphosphoribosyl-dephospho-CoA synthase CitG [Oscillospiraceae bacterium]